MTQYCAPACGVCGGASPPPEWNGPTCRDFHPSCATWAINDQCTANPQYMNENCKVSCGQCSLVKMDNRLAACGFSRSSRQRLTSISSRENSFVSTSLEKPSLLHKAIKGKKVPMNNCGIPSQNSSFTNKEQKGKTINQSDTYKTPTLATYEL